MFRLLARLFINKEKQPTAERREYGVLSGVVGIVVNTLLFLLKMVVGSASGSISVMADGFNNFNDMISSVVSILGFKMSARGADKEHPFGHGRSEYVAGLLVAFLMIMVGFEFLQSSFLRILNPEEMVFDYYMVAMLIISILLKLWMWRYNLYAGKLIKSPTLFATAKDSLNDSIITLVTLISMLFSKYSMVDGYMGLIISVFIMYSGIKSLGETLSPLLGEAADSEVVEAIENLLTQCDGIIGVHDFVLHNYGNGKRMATIHVEVPNNSDIVTIHNMVDEAEKHIFSEFDIFIVIHVDPVPINDRETNNAKADLKKILADIDPKLKIHDFRLVHRDHHKNLIFDLVIPFSYTEKSRNELVLNLKNSLVEVDKKYNPVITLDHEM